MTIVFNSVAAAKRTAGVVADRNSAMPGSTWSIPIEHCHVGTKLRDVPGSVCHGCYVIKTEKMYTSVVKS